MAERDRQLPTAVEIAQREGPPPWSKCPEIWKNQSQEILQESNTQEKIKRARGEIRRHFRPHRINLRPKIKDIKKEDKRNKILKVAGFLTTSAGLLTGTVTTFLSALHRAEGSLTWALSNGHLYLPVALLAGSVVTAGLAISAIKKH